MEKGEEERRSSGNAVVVPSYIDDLSHHHRGVGRPSCDDGHTAEREMDQPDHHGRSIRLAAHAPTAARRKDGNPLRCASGQHRTADHPFIPSSGPADETALGYVADPFHVEEDGAIRGGLNDVRAQEEAAYVTQIAQLPYERLTLGSVLGSGFFGRVHRGTISCHFIIYFLFYLSIYSSLFNLTKLSFEWYFLFYQFFRQQCFSYVLAAVASLLSVLPFGPQSLSECAGRLDEQDVAIKKMVRRNFRNSSETQLFIKETSVFWCVVILDNSE